MAAPTKADLTAMFNLAPQDAIAYLESKGHKITWDWHESNAASHARSFTVAKGMRLDIQQDLLNGLRDNLKAGGSLRDYQDALTPILQDKGWWGKQVIVNRAGDAQLVQLGSPRRLATIYQTNMQSAYMAGRYNAAIQATDTHPYWMYIAVADGRTRPSHMALHRKVFQWDDPIWQTIIPPNGFNCRCRIIALTEREVNRRGLIVESSEGKLTSKEVEMGVSERTGEVRTDHVSVLQTTDQAGKPVTFSPDPGFSGGPQQSSLLDNQVFAKARRNFPEPTAIAEMQTLLLSEPRQQAWEAFVDNTRQFEVYLPRRAAAKVVDQNRTFGVGVLGTAELAALEAVGIQPHSGVVFMRDSLLVSPKAQRHQAAGNALTVTEWKRLPQMLSAPDLVLLEGGRTLLYVTDIGSGMVIKIAVRADRATYTKQGVDDVATASKVARGNIEEGIQNGMYEIVRGAGFEPDNR